MIISIHALLAESDLYQSQHTIHPHHFYPRSPCGERRRHRGNDGSPVYFYPRSPCGERRPASITPTPSRRISIHALLAESDDLSRAFCSSDIKFLSTLSLRRATKVAVVVPSGSLYFYPRSPCGERRLKVIISSITQIFLSTLSLRRAT